MGCELIGMWLADPKNWLIVLEVAAALGMVIFVHELGHFAVAKACGVKCEKFYLGFDIYGLKIVHKQWGETEYGIGILPLGGYVKMLGQDDNPANAAEEHQRSLVGDSETLDPRSLLAQSVPKRLAIFSAGVLMNLIFAYLLAAVAYELGVRETPCIVGGIAPGEAAWKAGLKTGDRIVAIGDLSPPSLRFRDLQNGVVLSGDKVKFVVLCARRQGANHDLHRARRQARCAAPSECSAPRRRRWPKSRSRVRGPATSAISSKRATKSSRSVSSRSRRTPS